LFAEFLVRQRRVRSGGGRFFFVFGAVGAGFGHSKP
jgi:hypothetical protein